MARFFRNYALETGMALGAIGLVLAVVSYSYRFADAPAWLDWYGNLLGGIPGATVSGHNLWIMILGTILLISGAWSAGEQLVLRRRFERLIETPKKSEFVANRRDLDGLARRLPEGYKARVKAKENEFRSTR